MLLLVIIGGLLFNYAEVTAGIYVLVGLFIGAMLRDIGWLRRFVKTWPSTAAVLDWDILETLLEEESSPEEPEIMKEVRD